LRAPFIFAGDGDAARVVIDFFCCYIEGIEKGINRQVGGSDF